MNIREIKHKTQQAIGLRLLNTGLLAIFGPMAGFFSSLVYVLRYARWYKDCSVRNKLLYTDQPFGQKNRYVLYDHIVETYNLETQPFQYLEFGVASGRGIKWWIEKNNNPESQFVGFDTFEGLPEDWGDLPKGYFSTKGGPPDIKDERCSFQIGLFQSTLPSFVRNEDFSRKRTIIHIDCDLYSATIFALLTLGPVLKKGDIIIFDEFADVTHEFRAYCDFISASYIELNIIAAVNGGRKIGFIVAE